MTSTSALFLFSMVIYCVNACGSKSDHDQNQVSTALKPFSIEFHIFDWQFNIFIRLVVFKIIFFLPDLYVFVSINKIKSEDLSDFAINSITEKGSEEYEPPGFL